ncbi:cell division topological specificity factor MinE [Alsobacter sp. SYSU M60028]|uniref:Cell division topological specificity factor n=1 Tax=Alsobacter ponti TaxID=2962936 RepID=A0ABT1LKD5_9HYPH|nr:cell division topological specificity factor MinE [Alsobacter ponti]MCP8940713.1 cell division topological specificity factor MinE [Alsobacter ponti]
MNILSLFLKRNTAPVARERLQILLAHERAVVGGSDLVAVLREEILAVIAKHMQIDPGAVRVKMDRNQSLSTLEVEVDIPAPSGARPGDKPAETAAEDETPKAKVA